MPDVSRPADRQVPLDLLKIIETRLKSATGVDVRTSAVLDAAKRQALSEKGKANGEVHLYEDSKMGIVYIGPAAGDTREYVHIEVKVTESTSEPTGHVLTAWGREGSWHTVQWVWGRESHKIEGFNLRKETSPVPGLRLTPA